MGFPDKKQIKNALKKIKKIEGTQGPPEHPTPLERFRYDLQQEFVRYKLKTKISQKDMALLLGVDEGKVSKILHNHLNGFSTDRLISLLEKISPNIKLKVS
ncbi:MAG: helix-turn-helix domain-containing protein [Bdellovibrionaceae bacterium]|nr:helix-turn-helix domain-containing protein [Pseudobdellovibrionaceae bacterium]